MLRVLPSEIVRAENSALILAALRLSLVVRNFEITAAISAREIDINSQSLTVSVATVSQKRVSCSTNSIVGA